MTAPRTALAIVLALAVPVPGSAQEISPPDPGAPPEAVACALFRHLLSDRWDAAAGLYEERFLETWHRALIRRLPRDTDEEYERFLRKGIAVDSVEELRTLSFREAAARALRAYDPAYRRAVALDDPFFVVSAADRRELATGHVPDHVRAVVGAVVDGDRAWVGYRRVSAAGPAPDAAPLPPWAHFRPLQLLALVRTDRGWRVSPGDPHALLEEAYSFGVDSRSSSRRTWWPFAAAAPTPCPDATNATGVPAYDAERIAGEFLELVDRERWAEAAGFFAADVLADWHAVQLERWGAPAGTDARSFVMALFGVESVEEVEGLSPAEAAARNLERMREGLGTGREDGPRAELRSEILGTIAEDDLAHVLYRVRRTFEEAGPEKRRIEIAPVTAWTVTLRRTESGWTVLPRSTVLLEEFPSR